MKRFNFFFSSFKYTSRYGLLPKQRYTITESNLKLAPSNNPKTEGAEKNARYVFNPDPTASYVARVVSGWGEDKHILFDHYWSFFSVFSLTFHHLPTVSFNLQPLCIYIPQNSFIQTFSSFSNNFLLSLDNGYFISIRSSFSYLFIFFRNYFIVCQFIPFPIYTICANTQYWF